MKPTGIVRKVDKLGKTKDTKFHAKKVLFTSVIFIGLSIPILTGATSISHFSSERLVNKISGNNYIKDIPVNHKQEVDGIEMHISDLTLSEGGLALNVESNEKGERDSGHYLRAGNIEFHITDEQGKEILSHSGKVKGAYRFGKWYFSSKKIFDPISKDVKELTITPYLILPTDGGGVVLDQDGNGKSIKIDYSKLKNVEFKSFTVKITHHKN